MECERATRECETAPRGVTVVPVRFKPGEDLGDFRKMLRIPEYALNGVMAFNDNTRQWVRFLNTKQKDAAGGGNACARPYQHTGDAIGIPTGPFASLDEISEGVEFPEDGVQERTAKEIIDRAFVQIRDLFVARPDKHVLYYSAEDDSDDIGLAIFKGSVGVDVIEYITAKLKALPDEVGHASTP